MSKRIDLQGKKYGRLSIKTFAYYSNHNSYWNCICDCGNQKVVCAHSLRSGNTKSCGCLKKDLTIKRERKDEVGNKYHRLIVKEFAYIKKRRAMWKCICDCGKETIVSGVLLRNGIAKSCGCLKIEKTIDRNKQKPSIKTRQKMSKNHADFKGIKSGRWNFDLTEIERNLSKDRSMIPGYLSWRNAIYKKDNYICQKCGSNNRLNAHHLNNYKNYPEQRTDINNGILLCKICHTIFHNYYGKNTNKKQMEEFLGKNN